MTNEEIRREILEAEDGDKSRAISAYEVSENEKQVELMKIEAEAKKAKKDRILGYCKIGGTVLLGVLYAYVSRENSHDIQTLELNGAVRSKAWFGLRPEKVQEIR